jgi:hypothetical protein
MSRTNPKLLPRSANEWMSPEPSNSGSTRESGEPANWSGFELRPLRRCGTLEPSAFEWHSDGGLADNRRTSKTQVGTGRIRLGSIDGCPSRYLAQLLPLRLSNQHKTMPFAEGSLSRFGCSRHAHLFIRDGVTVGKPQYQRSGPGRVRQHCKREKYGHEQPLRSDRSITADTASGFQLRWREV